MLKVLSILKVFKHFLMCLYVACCFSAFERSLESPSHIQTRKAEYIASGRVSSYTHFETGLKAQDGYHPWMLSTFSIWECYQFWCDYIYTQISQVYVHSFSVYDIGILYTHTKQMDMCTFSGWRVSKCLTPDSDSAHSNIHEVILTMIVKVSPPAPGGNHWQSLSIYMGQNHVPNKCQDTIPEQIPEHF